MNVSYKSTMKTGFIGWCTPPKELGLRANDIVKWQIDKSEELGCTVFQRFPVRKT